MIIDTTLTKAEHQIAGLLPWTFKQKTDIVRKCFQYECGWRLLEASCPEHLLFKLEMCYHEYHSVRPDAKEHVLLMMILNIFGELSIENDVKSLIGEQK